MAKIRSISKRAGNTRKRRKRFEDCAVWAFYRGGLDRDKDRAIQKAAGRHSDGSGYALLTHERDHSWQCESLKEAFTLAKRIRREIRGVRVRVLQRVWRWVNVPLDKKG